MISSCSTVSGESSFTVDCRIYVCSDSAVWGGNVHVSPAPGLGLASLGCASSPGTVASRKVRFVMIPGGAPPPPQPPQPPPSPSPPGMNLCVWQVDSYFNRWNYDHWLHYYYYYHCNNKYHASIFIQHPENYAFLITAVTFPLPAGLPPGEASNQFTAVGGDWIDWKDVLLCYFIYNPYHTYYDWTKPDN